MRFIKSNRLLILVLLLIISISIIFSGCSSRDESNANEMYSVEAPAAIDNSYGMMTVEYDQAINEEFKLTSSISTNSEQYEQMIIYNGSLYIEVDDITDAANQINSAVLNASGYLVNSYKNENDHHINAHYEYKIPADQFHNIFKQIENMEIGKVTSQNTGSANVTEEYYDIEARLKAKRAYEARLLEFLEKAEKTEDLLKIANDLNHVQEEIESLEGRQKYLEHHTDNSTLVVELIQYKDKVAPTASTFEKAIEGFKDSIKFLVDFFEGIFIWTITFIPILFVLAIVLIVVLIIKRSYRRRKNSKKNDGNQNEIS